MCWNSLLFTGLLINRDSVSPWFSWLHNLSFFHAAYEALTVNELRYLTLKEKRVSITPPIDYHAAANVGPNAVWC